VVMSELTQVVEATEPHTEEEAEREQVCEACGASEEVGGHSSASSASCQAVMDAQGS